jgi:hypothetical protein
MQFNFYMSTDDRDAFHAFIFERGGYIVPLVARTPEPDIFRSPDQDSPLDFQCSIYKEEVFASRNLHGRRGLFGLKPGPWVTPYHGGYYSHGPNLEYVLSLFRDGAQRPGRVYAGGTELIGGYREDGRRELRDGTLISDAEAAALERKLINFYRGLAAHIRKHYRSDGFYFHGPGSDAAERAGVAKEQRC